MPQNRHLSERQCPFLAVSPDPDAAVSSLPACQLVVPRLAVADLLGDLLNGLAHPGTVNPGYIADGCRGAITGTSRLGPRSPSASLLKCKGRSGLSSMGGSLAQSLRPSF